ncbi:hypothetical protein EWH21_23300 [Pseudomonas sp. REST10]|uniref:DsbA family protein n=1 Tax=Pseudomonas sp. REST10 TaxID=2512235 RepID=UPI00240E5F0B|nr:DsbA family protein [Pseudomonas sp. REST10]WFC64529.1 hypothetical protein EWH21_23300 [Pseudomonas sp. REST10]
MKTLSCDDKSGICYPSALDDAAATDEAPLTDTQIIYIGDPMCSWCWGIEPALRELQDHCELRGLSFSIVLGGLRPGGGDPWNAEFKAFLRQHWEEIGEATGQPFSFDILERAHFSYDTEPACRAVVTARHMLAGASSRKLYAIFSAIQRKFYVANADPTQLGFYESIIEGAGLDFARFTELYEGDSARQWTRGDFELSHRLQVRAFPTLLARTDSGFVQLATGFARAASLIVKVEDVFRS